MSARMLCIFHATKKMPKSWIIEILRDLLWCIAGIDPDFDPAGTRPVSQLPWYVSAIFCLMVPGLVLLCGGLMWVLADLIRAMIWHG